MDIERREEPKAKVTLAESVIDLNKYESLPFSATHMVATIDYIVDKFNIQNPAVIEVGPVPGEYYGSLATNPEGLRDEGVDGVWTKFPHYSFKSDRVSTVTHREGNNPPIRYLADSHPEWKLVALGVHDIPQELKDTLLGAHADLYMYDTGHTESDGLSASTFYHHPEDDIAEAYPKLIRKLGGKRPDIIAGQHVFSHSSGPYESDGLTMEACRLLPIGGFFIVYPFGEKEDIKNGLPFGAYPFDFEKNMKLVTRMEFSRAHSDGSGIYKTHVLVYQKVADSVHPAVHEEMDRIKKRMDEWKAKGWKLGEDD